MKREVMGHEMKLSKLLPGRLEHILSLPPHVLLRKMYNRIKSRIKKITWRFSSHWLVTEINDDALLQNLSDQFSSIHTYLTHLIGYEGSRFFQVPSHRREYIEAFHKAFPDSLTLYISEADQIYEHIINLLCSGPQYLGEKIDWHVDFKTGYRFDPHLLYFDVRPAPYPGGYDIKSPWELSRCQHLVRLGQAYWLTNDEKYTTEFVAQVEGWIKDNPWPWGVNWSCTMDVAIRVVNWSWGYHFFNKSLCLPDEFRLRFHKILLAHGHHIYRNLENDGRVTGNHYLSNLVGLVYLGFLCPEFKESLTWRECGLRELETEIFNQVYHDGCNFESSTGYHRLALELFLSVTAISLQNGHTFSQAYFKRLENMLEYTKYIITPDGTTPFIGDNDNGRLHRLKAWEQPEREWTDFRYLLGIGAVIFDRLDFAACAGDQWEEAFWFFGNKALDFRDKSKKIHPNGLKLNSRAFEDGGIYIIRDQDDCMIIDAGSEGQNGSGGHAHNDALSFTLQAGGTSWIIDPGTFTYTQDYEQRHNFRSTKFHNVVQPNNLEQNIFSPKMPFKIIKPAQINVSNWQIGFDHVMFRGKCKFACDNQTAHERTVFFDQINRIWLITDRVSGAHEMCKTYLHVPPDLIVDRSSIKEGFLVIDKQEQKLIIKAFYPESSSHYLEDGWISMEYGERIVAPVLIWEWNPKYHHIIAIGLESTDKSFQDRVEQAQEMLRLES